MKKYVEIAVGEIKQTRRDEVQRYLQKDEISKIDGNYEIERVVEIGTDVVVFFKIKDNQYFIGVTIDAQKFQVYNVFVQNGNSCYLTATSDHLTLKEMSQFTKLKNSGGWSKGDLRRDGKSAYDFSRISYRFEISESLNTMAAIASLLDHLEKDIEGIINLAKNTDAVIAVNKHQHVYGDAGLYLDIETMKRATNLNLSIDIDGYIVGEWASE